MQLPEILPFDANNRHAVEVELIERGRSHRDFRIVKIRPTRRRVGRLQQCATTADRAEVAPCRAGISQGTEGPFPCLLVDVEPNTAQLAQGPIPRTHAVEYSFGALQSRDSNAGRPHIPEAIDPRRKSG